MSQRNDVHWVVKLAIGILVVGVAFITFNNAAETGDTNQLFGFFLFIVPSAVMFRFMGRSGVRSVGVEEKDERL